MGFNEFKEHAVRAGLGTAFCFMLPSEKKYHIVAAVESMPSVFGDPDTIEYSSTTNMTRTQVMGKKSTETIEISIPYNIDNINIANKIKGVKCNYAYIDLDDFSGQEFVGEATYRMGDVGTDDIKTIVLSIVVSEAKDAITKDLYDLYEDTISFESTLPNVIELTNSDTAGKEFNIVVEPSEATITVTSNGTGLVTATYSNGKLTITPVSSSEGGSTTVLIEAKADNYASNSREIKVIVE